MKSQKINCYVSITSDAAVSCSLAADFFPLLSVDDFSISSTKAVCNIYKGKISMAFYGLFLF